MLMPRRAFLQAAGLTGAGVLSGRLARRRDNSSADRALLAQRIEAAWGGGLRGAGVSSRVRDRDIAAFAATGGNVVRVMCTHHPLLSLEPPYRLDSNSFRRLDQILAACRRNGVRAIIDPHTFPGMQSRYTCYPSDRLWRSQSLQDKLIGLWGYIANRYRNHDEVVGYDLLNEPAVPDVSANRGLASWNALARRMSVAVRARDTQTHVIIEPAVGPGPNHRWYDRFASMRYLLAPPVRRVVVSPHMYAPHGFTYQGVNGTPGGYSYPGTVDGQYWNKAALAAYMAPAHLYQRRHGVPVWIGEFSAPRWTAADGIRYLRDSIDLFEGWGWDWTYIGWREYQGWDAELGPDPRNRHRRKSTPRLNLLRHYYARNRGDARGHEPLPRPERRGRHLPHPIPLHGSP